MSKCTLSIGEGDIVRAPKDFYRSTLNRAISIGVYATLFKQKSLAKEESTVQMIPFGTVEHTADFIKKHCTTIYENVKSSGKLIYRGEETSTPTLLSTPSDLLLPSAYDNPVTADFFKSVNTALHRNNQSSIFPDEAHIASPNPMVASKWGPVCSIWPLDSMHYAWVRSGNLWWDDEWQTFQGPRGPLFWRSNESLDRFLKEEVYMDKYLEAALLRDADIMFQSNIPTDHIDSIVDDLLRLNSGTSSSTGVMGKRQVFKNWIANTSELYIAVPIALEAKLLEALSLELRADKVPVVLGKKSMDIGDDDIRRLQLRNY